METALLSKIEKDIESNYDLEGIENFDFDLHSENYTKDSKHAIQSLVYFLKNGVDESAILNEHPFVRMIGYNKVGYNKSGFRESAKLDEFDGIRMQAYWNTGITDMANTEKRLDEIVFAVENRGEVDRDWCRSENEWKQSVGFAVYPFSVDNKRYALASNVYEIRMAARLKFGFGDIEDTEDSKAEIGLLEPSMYFLYKVMNGFTKEDRNAKSFSVASVANIIYGFEPKIVTDSSKPAALRYLAVKYFQTKK